MTASHQWNEREKNEREKHDFPSRRCVPLKSLNEMKTLSFNQ